MPSESTIPSTARCLSCGYLLRGLPSEVCPECGREFDPADASTYDLRPPDWRRQRKIKRIALTVIGCIALWVAFGPRALLKGKLEFKCSVCGEATTFYRWEPQSLRWNAPRFPGAHWTGHHSASPTGRPPPCLVHSYNVSVKFDLHNRGSAQGSSSIDMDSLIINGHTVSIESGPRILKALMSPTNNGISIGR